MKKILILTLAFLAFFAASAQKKQNVYFFRNNASVTNRDSADLIRIIQEPDSGSTLFNLFEFYHAGQRKTVGRLIAFDPRLIYDGLVASYYENGNRKSAEQFAGGMLSGMAYYYFPNGKLESSIDYVPLDLYRIDMKTMSLADSSGNVLLKDGNGHVLVRFTGDQGWQEKGDYLAGKKEGVWITKNAVGDSSYKETYTQGNFIQGESVLQGVSYSYKDIEEAPGYKDGISGFYAKVNKYILNSPAYRRSHVSGKVDVTFVIETDGRLTGQKVVKSLSRELDKLALEIIAASPNWLPGRQHGIPVRVSFTLPITFKAE